MAHAFGWKRDSVDSRDHRFALTAPVALPPKLTLAGLPPVLDQGPLGCCVFNATANAELFDARKQGIAGAALGSRLFGYYRTRVLEKTTKQDAGCSIRDAFKVIAKDGLPPEALWPYDVATYAQRPPRRAYAVAKAHRALEYLRVEQTVPALKAAIAAGFPVVVGIACFPEIESEAVAKTGLLPTPSGRESPIGGHAILAFGFDDAMNAFLCENSWGTPWGQEGNLWLPYDYAANPAWSSDWWCVRSVS